jgi:2-polyprenyl-3-methyl-5-hydroxy-6-metoxy-1,4-benzoquinol methylase
MSDQGAEGLLSPFLKAQRLKKVRKYIKGRVLDFGCGTGDLGPFCNPEAYLGFDIDTQSLSIAKGKYPHLAFTDRFPSPYGSDEKFDSIILPAVIEHIDDPASLLKVLKMHLAADGYIVMTTPHPSLG